MDIEHQPINDERHPLLSTQDASKKRARRALTAALIFTTIFMVGEIVGGYIANSLAIMTDAAHLLTDIGAMCLSLFAMWLSGQSPTSSMSFGFHRAEILGALASVLTIWALTGILVYEAIQRVLHIHSQHVDGKIMFIVACGGLFVNLLDAFILHAGGAEHSHSHGGGGHSHSHGHGDKKKKDKEGHSHKDGHSHSHAEKKGKHKDHKHKEHSHEHSHGDKERTDIDIHNVLNSAEPQETAHSHAHKHKKGDKKEKGGKKISNINVHAAFIHVVGDCVQSVGVMGASALIWWHPDWKLADPIVTFVFSIIVLFTTIQLLRQSLAVLMEGVPQGVIVADVQRDLESITHVTAIHDLHIWSITVGQPALSVHLTVDDDASISTDAILEAANRILREEHSILHTTIQIERSLSKAVCDTMAFHGHPKGK